ncbi:hypothetical protein [Parvibium lacunae]|nr:hypothetical protein [Parvibium lacunae]
MQYRCQVRFIDLKGQARSVLDESLQFNYGFPEQQLTFAFPFFAQPHDLWQLSLQLSVASDSEPIRLALQIEKDHRLETAGTRGIADWLWSLGATHRASGAPEPAARFAAEGKQGIQFCASLPLPYSELLECHCLPDNHVYWVNQAEATLMAMPAPAAFSINNPAPEADIVIV